MMKVMIPFDGIPEEYSNMYFRGERFFCRQNGEVHIDPKGMLQTNTYYNGFSIRKWRKYTRINDLFLCIEIKGECLISVCNSFRSEHSLSSRSLISKEIYCQEKTVVQLDLSQFIEADGIISFTVKAAENTIIYAAEYMTHTKKTEVNLALAVCTFKRETYVYRLIEDYKHAELENVQLFISDNGKTLRDDGTNGVHIFQNKNYGGAGGFARCMLEVKRFNNSAQRSLSHIVLMDDDILLDMRVVKRTIAFLQILKDEFQTCFLCGAMCSLDEPNQQYERNSGFTGGNSFLQFGANFDLSDELTCVINEEDVELTRFRQSTAGWWYCCFSTKILSSNNYPFPCFFRGDDIEFALRNGSRVITINGINVWHEPFYKKYSNTAEKYYLVRNLLVVNLLYRESAVEDSIRYLDSCVKMCLYQFDYEGLELVIQALDDFFKGPRFFAELNAEEYNKIISQKNHKMIPFTEALEDYDFDNIVYQVNQYSDSHKIVRIIRKMTLNGYLIPLIFYKDFRIAGVGYKGRSYSYFRRKRVFNADTYSYKGYYTSIDKKRALYLYLEYKKRVHYMKNNYDAIKRDYTLNFIQLQTESFWVNYLGIKPI